MIIHATTPGFEPCDWRGNSASAPGAESPPSPTTNEPTIGAKPLAPTAVHGAEKAEVDPRMLEAAREFEAVFVRQLLKSSSLAGGKGNGGHSAMVLESLAKTVTSGDGIGLAQRIEQMLAPHRIAEEPTE